MGGGFDIFLSFGGGGIPFDHQAAGDAQSYGISFVCPAGGVSDVVLFYHLVQQYDYLVLSDSDRDPGAVLSLEGKAKVKEEARGIRDGE